MTELNIPRMQAVYRHIRGYGDQPFSWALTSMIIAEAIELALTFDNEPTNNDNEVTTT